MAIDLKNHRLFLGCGGSKTMVMMDSTSGKVIASVPIGQGVDANAFDPGTGWPLPPAATARPRLRTKMRRTN